MTLILNLRRMALFLLMATFGLSLHAAIPKGMIVLSSHSYDTGDDSAKAITVNTDNIFVTGISDDKYFSIKYNKSLLPIQTTSYYSGISGDNPRGIAVSNNIIVVGEVPNGADQDWFISKYSPDFQGVFSSAVFNGGQYDGANAVTIDNLNNIFVTGYTNDGATDNFYTVKYDMDLSILASVTRDSGNNEVANAIAMDSSDNVISVGSQYDGVSWNYFIVKYNNSLGFLDEAIFASSNDEKASGVAVDSQNNIIVVGRQYDGSTQNYLTVKYDKNLNFVSSSTYDSGQNDIATGVAVDSYDNIVVTGRRVNDYNTIKYDSDFVIISSAVYDSGYIDIANSVVIDNEGNIIVTGQNSDGSSNNYFTIKYNGSPLISDIDPLYQGETSNTQITGKCFYDSSVLFSNVGISTDNVSVVTSNKIGAEVTVAASVLIGVTSVTVTNSNGEYVQDTSFAEVHAKKTVLPSASEVVTARAIAGYHTVNIPAGTFPVTETVTISARPVEGDRQIGEGIYLANEPINTPLKAITVKLYYRDEDLGGYDEGRITLAYYDGIEYVTLTSVLNTSENSLTATTQVINKKFAILKAADSTAPSLDLSVLKVFPNPYKPGSGGNFDDSPYGKGVVFSGLEGEFKLTILSIAGELVFSETVVADSSKKYIWDVKSDKGETASGVYIYIIENASGASETLKGKFSIIR